MCKRKQKKAMGLDLMNMRMEEPLKEIKLGTKASQIDNGQNVRCLSISIAGDTRFPCKGLK